MKKNSYIYNRNLRFIKKGFEGNRTENNKFVNLVEREYPSLREALRWKLTQNPQKEEKSSENYKLPVQKNSDFINKNDDCIVWLGHCSFYIRINGVSLLTDPIFHNLPFIKRQIPSPVPAKKIRYLDLILISHSHRDHLDKKSLKTLMYNNPHSRILTGLKVGKVISEIGSSAWKVQEAGWYQQYSEVPAGITVDFLPAHHWSRRGVFDMNRTLWGGFMIQARGKKIYFCGDSAYSDHFRDIGRLYGKIDLALLPIGAYKPHYMMNKSHMNPKQAVKAFNELKADTFIPMHYGTYDLSDEPLGEPEKKMRKYEKKERLCGNLHLLQPGEVLNI